MKKKPTPYPGLITKNLTIGERLRMIEGWYIIKHTRSIDTSLFNNIIGVNRNRHTYPNISWLIENISQDDWQWNIGSINVYFRNQEDAVFYELSCL